MKKLLQLVIVLFLIITNIFAQVIPSPVTIDIAKTKVEQIVTVFGTANTANFNFPNFRFYLADSTGTILVDGLPLTVFNVNKGDTISVTGVVKDMNGVITIASDETKKIKILVAKQKYNAHQAAIQNATLSDVLANPKEYEGKNVTLPNIVIENPSDWPNDVMKFKDIKEFNVIDTTANKVAKMRIYGSANIDGQANPLLTPKTITAFVTLDANNNPILVPGSIQDLGGTYVPITGKTIYIEEARLPGYVGKTVTVAGVVNSVNFGSATASTYFITDGTAGMYLYKAPVLEMGDSIIVTGAISVYNGLTEITVTSHTLLKKGAFIPAPIELTIPEFLKLAEYYEGQLLKIKNIKLRTGSTWPTPATTGSGWNVRYVDATDEVSYLDIRVLKSLGFYEISDSLKTLFTTKILDVVGLMSQYTTSGKGGYQLMPRSTADFIVKDGVSQIVKANLEEKIAYNYPNPFNPVTNIVFKLNNSANVTLKVYDVTGRMITELVNSKLAAGIHNVQFNANNLNSGLYFYELNIDGKRFVNKMMLVK